MNFSFLHHKLYKQKIKQPIFVYGKFINCLLIEYK